MGNSAITDVKLSDIDAPVRVKLEEAGAIGDIVYKAVSGDYGLAVCTDPLKVQATHILTQAGAAGASVCAISLTGSIELVVAPALAVATKYVLSATPGKAALRSDLVSPNALVELWNGASATLAQMSVNATGLLIP